MKKKTFLIMGMGILLQRECIIMIFLTLRDGTLRGCLSMIESRP
ncbi:MAG: hypothetical protein R6T98_13190 [Desulfatiglandales bacterium]